MKDNNKNRQFDTGSQRDQNEDKGRMDLVPFEVFIGKFVKNDILDIYANYDELHDQKKAIKDLPWLMKTLSCAITDESIISDPDFREDMILSGIIEACAISGYNTLKSMGRDEVTSIQAVFQGIIDLSKHYQLGAKKYGENNWKKGQPTSVLLDSATRHLAKFIAGWDDENHIIAVAWNIVALLYFNPEIERVEE